MSIVWGAPQVERAAATSGGTRVESYQISIDDVPRALRVWTPNSIYEIEVADAARQEVVIRGGRHFGESCLAKIAGARRSADELWRGSIHVGFRLEIHRDDEAIVTGIVCRIEIQPEATDRSGS